MLPHMLSSSDIAPSGYWVFWRVQHDLAGHQFSFFDEIEKWL